jgi:predicted MPP superfamily phosphohydrolase
MMRGDVAVKVALAPAHQGRISLMSEELLKLRREMDRVLRKPGTRPDRATTITRRTFLHKSILTGAAATAGAAAYGWLPLINTLDVAVAQGAQPFRFAWVSDTHLYPRDVNQRFVDKAVRAFKEVQEMNPPADFFIFGGDLAQLGDPVEIELGAELLKEVSIQKLFIPGEHDWYLDMGELWVKTFGESPWSIDHKGVHIIGLNTVGTAPDYWSATKMTPQERMGHMSVLDGTVAGAWAGLGQAQLEWLSSNLANLSNDQPIIIFSHNPLYEYYPPWNFWVRDWRQVHEILARFTNVTNVHGHTHQVLYNEIGALRSIGMLATSWPWPYAPEGVPALTKPMIRADPGDHFDGVGWDRLQFTDQGRVENQYMMWGRAEVFAETGQDSGTGDNGNQILHPRIADNMWPY